MLGLRRSIPEHERLHGSLTLLASVIVWMVVWLLAIQLLVGSGALRRLMSGTLASLPERRVETTLFRAAALEAHPFFAIGDSDFQREVASRLPEGVEVTAWTHQWMDLASLMMLLSEAAQRNLDVVLVQNLPPHWSSQRPHYMSDFSAEAFWGAQFLPLWDRERETRPWWSPRGLSDIDLLLSTFELWARTATIAPPTKPQRIRSLLGVTWVLPRERLSDNLEPVWQFMSPEAVHDTLNLINDIPALRVVRETPPLPQGFTDKLYWVSDLTKLPADTPAELIENFQAYFYPGRFDDLLGHIVSFDQLDSVFSARAQSP